MTVGYGHGPMEQAVTRMIRMRTEMMRALDDELGPQHWKPAPNDDGVIESGCNDGASSSLTLRTYSFAGTYPEGSWHDAAATVERIGRRYGFDEIRHTVDRPGNLDMTGLAPDGGSYTFGMAKATTLAIRTGCYKWAETPGPDAWLTIDPTPGQPS